MLFPSAAVIDDEAAAHPRVSGGMRARKDATNSSRDTRPSWQMSRRRIQAYTLAQAAGAVVGDTVNR